MKLHKIWLLMVATVMSLSLSAHTLRSPQDVLQLEVGLNQKGTPVYELRRGEKCSINVDIYSLGMVMYKLLNCEIFCYCAIL